MMNCLIQICKEWRKIYWMEGWIGNGDYSQLVQTGGPVCQLSTVNSEESTIKKPNLDKRNNEERWKLVLMQSFSTSESLEKDTFSELSCGIHRKKEYNYVCTTVTSLFECLLKTLVSDFEIWMIRVGIHSSHLTKSGGYSGMIREFGCVWRYDWNKNALILPDWLRTLFLPLILCFGWMDLSDLFCTQTQKKNQLSWFTNQ